MKPHLSLITGSLLCICASAQAQNKWSLSECMQYAIDHNIELKQQELNVENSEIELNTSLNKRLPDLSAGAGQSVNFGRSPSMATGIYEQNTSAGTSFSLYSSLPIYNGLRIAHEINSNELNLQAATEGFNRAKENLSLNVAGYYLEVLFKKELLKVSVEQCALTTKQVERTQIMADEGKVPRSQVYDLKAQWAKEELARINAQNDLSQSLLNLAQLLNVSNAESFDILEPEYLSSMDIALIQNPDAVYESALALKPVIKEADFRYRSSEVGIKMAKSYFLPTVNLGFSYNNGFNYLFGSGVNNISLSSQISNNQREAISLNISIPIFNRFQTRNQVRSAQLNRNNRALELDNAKINLQKEIQQAYRSALAAQARYYATETACQSSLEAFKYAEERYQLQMISAYEYSEAQTKLFSSRSEQVQAKYDFLFRVKILDFYSGVEIAL